MNSQYGNRMRTAARRAKRAEKAYRATSPIRGSVAWHLQRICAAASKAYNAEADLVSTTDRPQRVWEARR